MASGAKAVLTGLGRLTAATDRVLLMETGPGHLMETGSLLTETAARVVLTVLDPPTATETGRVQLMETDPDLPTATDPAQLMETAERVDLTARGAILAISRGLAVTDRVRLTATGRSLLLMPSPAWATNPSRRL
jgi:hypothetical protein